MKKFAIAAATATALTLTMANVAFAQTQATQAPMVLAAGEVTQAKEATSDTWITTKVKWFFMGEDALKGSDINVDTKDNVVTLKGTVKSAAGKARAMELANRTDGVKKVVDQLTIK